VIDVVELGEHCHYLMNYPINTHRLHIHNIKVRLNRNLSQIYILVDVLY